MRETVTSRRSSPTLTHTGEPSATRVESRRSRLAASSGRRVSSRSTEFSIGRTSSRSHGAPLASTPPAITACRWWGGASPLPLASARAWAGVESRIGTASPIVARRASQCATPSARSAARTSSSSPSSSSATRGSSSSIAYRVIGAPRRCLNRGFCAGSTDLGARHKTRLPHRRRSGGPLFDFARLRLAARAASRRLDQASARSFSCNSPLSYISTKMSQPPWNSPPR